MILMTWGQPKMLKGIRKRKKCATDRKLTCWAGRRGEGRGKKGLNCCAWKVMGGRVATDWGMGGRGAKWQVLKSFDLLFLSPFPSWAQSWQTARYNCGQRKLFLRTSSAIMSSCCCCYNTLGTDFFIYTCYMGNSWSSVLTSFPEVTYKCSLFFNLLTNILWNKSYCSLERRLVEFNFFIWVPTVII